jgi:hypothetical protein
MTPIAEIAYIDLFHPACRADSPEVIAAREACWGSDAPIDVKPLTACLRVGR